ncbi:MAG TPA: pitrilysin family protein [Thermoanaerobaculia bacterium]
MANRSPKPRSRVVRHVLDGGLTVLVDAMRDVRSLAVGVYVEAGSEDEPASRGGLSHFLEHVLFKRTRRRTNVAIARAVDVLGGDVDAFTTKEYTGFYAHTLDSRFAEAVDLLSDVVLAPAFNGADVENERGVILEEIGEANDNPEDLVHETFVRELWRDDPLGAPILGTEASIRAISRGDLRAFHRARYGSGRMIVSVAGRVDAGEAVARIEKAFRRARPRTARRAPARARRPRPRAHVSLQRRRSLEQAHVCLGMAAPPFTSPRRFASSLLDVVLGGGMSSRLFQEVREKRGLAYSIGSSLHAYRQAGYQAISAACATKNLERLLEVTLAELSRLRRDGVSPRELRWAKENLKGGLLLALESTVARMSASAREEFYFERPPQPERWIERVEAVTTDEVDEAARELLPGGALSLSVVGNVGKLPFTAEELRARVV